MKPLFLSILAPVLLLAACNPRPRLIGSPAPDFTVQDSDHKVSLHDLKGKPIVLNFWTSWCPPCVDEMPSLVQLQKRMGDRVTVFAVSWDQDDRAYHDFLKNYNVDLLTVRDAKAMSRDLYHSTGQPETFIIDSSGKIRRKIVGATNWIDPTMIDYLKTL